MMNTLWQVCAVPLDLPVTGQESGQCCPECQRDMMATAHANGVDLVLPDVVTSNTPPPTPLHDVYFFPHDEPCPTHAHTLPTHTTAPSWPLDLPQLCWVTRPPSKERGDGVQGEAKNTCLEWTQAGEDLKEVADTFHLEYRATDEHHQEPTLTTTIATGLALSLLCLLSWKLLTQTH